MGRTRFRVLLVESDGDARVTRGALASVTDAQFTIDHVSCFDAARESLRNASYDVVLLNWDVAGTDCLQTLADLRDSRGELVPVIVIYDHHDEAVARRAYDDGAQDFLVKQSLTADGLSRSMHYAVGRQRSLRQLDRQRRLIEQENERLARLCETAHRFVDNVCHEFRTPLTVVREFASIVRDGLDGPVTQRQAEHLDRVIHRADDLALMVDDMLDSSKLEAGVLGVWRRRCRVSELVENARSLLQSRAESKRVKLTSHVGPDLPEVYCDVEKARRVVINLVVNAIKFTPEGGTVDIRAQLTSGRSEVAIAVSDSGPGICREDVDIIFERFRQLRTNACPSIKGFGLGLNIASELARLNLGTLRVESEPGQGSTFTFALPRYDHSILADRYITELVSDADARQQVSLIVARVLGRHESAKEAYVLVDEFLHRSVRASDLVIPRDDRSWGVVVCCGLGDAERVVARLTNDWQVYMRNHASLVLPPLQLNVEGAWDSSEHVIGLRAKIADLLKAKQDERRRSRRVLVVDDDREVNACLGVRLQAAGFEVISAHDGEEGLAAALVERPDAVVLDILMPKKSGLEVLHEIRNYRETSNMPVVMLSANIRDQQQALEAGATYFVAKPYEAKSVMTAIESSMNCGSVS